jgi:hypothetical protein
MITRSIGWVLWDPKTDAPRPTTSRFGSPKPPKLLTEADARRQAPALRCYAVEVFVPRYAAPSGPMR